MAVNKITQTEIQNIEKVSTKTLPDSPSARGYSPDQIKKRMYGPTTKTLERLNEVIDEVNQELAAKADQSDLDNISLNVYDSVEEADGKAMISGSAAFIVSKVITI
ncbi:MAG: hypothetical protein AB7E61_07235 [Acholeplasmataceae bacterium]